MTWEEPAGAVVSVNVGRVREIVFHGETRTTAIWKEPCRGRLAVSTGGIFGDQQADRVNHGGTDKAVYAYAAEDAQWWARELDRLIPPGMFGENLTIRGVPVQAAVIGERWGAGTAVLEVVQPRFPCWKLGVRMGDAGFPNRFLAAGRAGAYLRVVSEGEVAAGDPVEVLFRPDHALTIGLVARLNHADRALALRLLKAAEGGSTPGELNALIGYAGVGVGAGAGPG